MSAHDPAIVELLKGLPKMDREPKVRDDELFAVAQIVSALPTVRFPIKSADELISQIGEGRVEILGVKLDATRLARRMPANLFPVKSLPEFVEKTAAVLRRNRWLARLGREVDELTRQLSDVHFPIASAEALLKEVGPEKKYIYRGRTFRPNEWIDRIPARFYPIRSPLDLKAKVGALTIRAGL